MKTKNKFYSLAIALSLLSASVLYVSCKHKLDKDTAGNKMGNCFDGVKNQNEEAVDCGGVCASCASCNDGVQNNDETGVDCGGAQCTTCSPPSSPFSCSSLNNQTYMSMSGTSSASAFGYILTSSPNRIHIDVGSNFNSISSYDIDLGSQSFSTMAVGAQRVYTTVGYNSSSSMGGGQAFVTITQGGSSFAQYSSKADQKIYIKRISSTLTQVWFCGLYTEDTASPQNTYNFSVSATF